MGAKRDSARLRETKDTKEDREKCIETMGTERDGVRLRETILCGYQRRLVETHRDFGYQERQDKTQIEW